VVSCGCAELWWFELVQALGFQLQGPAKKGWKMPSSSATQCMGSGKLQYLSFQLSVVEFPISWNNRKMITGLMGHQPARVRARACPPVAQYMQFNHGREVRCQLWDSLIHTSQLLGSSAQPQQEQHAVRGPF
jgi:hypothetical protein